jgi:hypothetical protein
MPFAAKRLKAYEASDNGLLNPDLAAGIRRVNGAKRLGMPLRNWMTADQGKKLLTIPFSESVRDRRFPQSRRGTLPVLVGHFEEHREPGGS